MFHGVIQKITFEQFFETRYIGNSARDAYVISSNKVLPPGESTHRVCRRLCRYLCHTDVWIPPAL